MGGGQARSENPGGRRARGPQIGDRHSGPGVEAADGRAQRDPVHGIGPVLC